MNIIETDKLTRRFGRTEAVHELDLAIPQGSVTALLGPNGAGKTTTLKLLMNLLVPNSGRARLLGVDTRRLGEAQFARIGYVSENQELPLWMTVQQLLDYCRPFYPAWDRDLEKSLLRQFELPLDRKLKNLSRGMLMKAALLSSLAYRPQLLVLDEPFSGLDPVVRDDVVRGLLESAEAGGWTVLVSSHDIEEVERLVDRVAVLGQGRLRLHETAEALLGRFRSVHVADAAPDAIPPYGALAWERTGRAATFVAPGYVADVSEREWTVRFGDAAVTVQPMSLRQIFVTLARAEKPVERGAAA
jgi:ABC-2 type transport system ATP-binding protein